MNERDVGKRVLVLALLGTLIIWLLAWSGGESGVALANRLNQTIPTPTRDKDPGEPPTRQPTTQLTSTMTPTSTPTPTVLPSPSLTVQPTGSVPAVTPVNTATSTPELPTETPTPPESPSPVPASPTHTATPAETKTLASSTPIATQTATARPAAATMPPTWTPTVAPPAVDRSGIGLWSGSCLWLAGGLILVGAGFSILLWRRRAQ